MATIAAATAAAVAAATASAAADKSTQGVDDPPRRKLTRKELLRAPVLTIVGLKIQCALEASSIGSNLVFRDEETRKQAFRRLEEAPAKQLLEECSQFDFYYVAWRPSADIAFYQLEPLDTPVFDSKRRIYIDEEFKPSGFECGPTNSTFVPVTSEPLVEHDPTLLEITSINAFFASCQPPRTPLMCPACRRLWTYIPG
ncbi:hypothetical protein JCM10212_003100 [Sporobolomyces blumeae]